MSRAVSARGLDAMGRLAAAATAVRAAVPTPATSLSALALRVVAAAPELPGAMTLQRLWTMAAPQRPLLVVSDGMGVDSLAMLLGLHRLGLRPDFVLHADTGDEHPETVAYREERRRWLRSIGFPELTMVRRAPSVSKVTGIPFATLGEKCIAYATLPSLAFAGGKACSVEWKIRPQEEWLARQPAARDLWARGQRVVKAIGYDAGPGDSRRAHHLTNDTRYDYVYPLREWGWDRARAIAEIRAAGLRVPRKSSCVFCPASKPWEIAELVRDWPHLADQIVELEDEAQPNLHVIEGLWGRTVKGTRGAIPRPGSMAVFIRALREDPDLLHRYLAMTPAPQWDDTADVGGVPQFKRAAPASPRHLPIAARRAA
jgi:hypothetical protein